LPYYTKEGLLKRQTKTLDTFKKKAKKKFGNRYSYSAIGVGIDKDTKVPIICKEHGIFYQLKGEHLRGVNCSKCASITKNRKLRNGKKLSKTKEAFLNESLLMHGNLYDYSNVEYINNNTKVELVCNIHGRFMTTPCSHLNMKTGCPLCKLSFGEREIFRFLIDRCIPFEREYTFDELKGVNGGLLRFDFYIKSINTIIEYDGEQHFIPIEQFGGIKGLKIVKHHDYMKDKFCNENNYKLLRITYKDKEKIRDILNECITL